MKSSAIGLGLAALLVVALVACSVEEQNKLEGTWELVEATYTPPDPGFNFNEWREVKIITRSYFSVMSQKRDRQKYIGAGTDAEILAAAKGFFAGAGTYTLAGDTYTENMEFCTVPNFADASIPYKITWDGNDRWTQTGTIPLKALGLAENDLELYEVWHRIK